MQKTLKRGFGFFLLFINIHAYSFSLQEKPHENPYLKAYVQTDHTVFNYNDPVYLKLIVSNNQNKNSFLKFYNNEQYSFLNYYVEVFQKNGVSVQERDDFFAKRFSANNKLQQLGKIDSDKNFNKLKLAPSAMIGKRINLKNLYDLAPGTYLVRLKFYPSSVFLNPFDFVYSPYIQIIIRNTSVERTKQMQQDRKWESKKHTIKTPQDTIKAFFDAKMNNNWEEFFYVVDLKSLIQRFRNFNDSFKVAKEEEKNIIIKDFKEYLKDINSDEKVVSYDVESLVIKEEQAIAKIIVKQQVEGRVFSREYAFKIEKKNHWYITAYSVLQK